MNAVQLACDQAIFTSIRTPTGEGYRIVAASPGLKPEEKQAITRNSPSHEALCPPPDDSGEQAMGAAFYTLPTGRLCVAFSCLAGAEHTGRGGFRVYTMNVVFERDGFAPCAFNPFNIIRGMAQAGLTQPLLKPPQTLSKVDLHVPLDPVPGAGPSIPVIFEKACRGPVLELAMSGDEVLVDLPQSWIGAAEALVLAVPGALREKVSFSAGLRFSTSRKHRLQLLHDGKNVLRKRFSSQGPTYIVAGDEAPAAVCESAWLQFVERHWQANDFVGLSRRTSRAFAGIGPTDIEEAGALFNLIDSLDKMPALPMIERVGAQIRSKQSNRNPDIVDEFLARAQWALNKRLMKAEVVDWTQAWRPLLCVWRQSGDGTAFAQPVVRGLVQAWAGREALSAAEAALDLTRDVPRDADADEVESLIEMVLGRLATVARRANESQACRVEELLSKWQRVRPNSAALASIVPQKV